VSVLYLHSKLHTFQYIYFFCSIISVLYKSLIKSPQSFCCHNNLSFPISCQPFRLLLLRFGTSLKHLIHGHPINVFLINFNSNAVVSSLVVYGEMMTVIFVVTLLKILNFSFSNTVNIWLCPFLFSPRYF
jgi:hypothetical protein